MKCPLTSKCHGKLSDQLIAARKAAKAKDVIIAEKDRIISVLEWQLQNLKIGILDLTVAARIKRSGYFKQPTRAGYRCVNCDFREIHINRSDMMMNRCGQFQHPVNRDLGTCKFHSAEVSKAKSEVA